MFKNTVWCSAAFESCAASSSLIRSSSLDTLYKTLKNKRNSPNLISYRICIVALCSLAFSCDISDTPQMRSSRRSFLNSRSQTPLRKTQSVDETFKKVGKTHNRNRLNHPQGEVCGTPQTSLVTKTWQDARLHQGVMDRQRRKILPFPSPS